MHRNLIIFSALALVACASAPTSQPETTGPEGHEESPDATTPESKPRVAAVAPTTLARGLHRRPMTEVVLDAHAKSALTLDDRGNLRLWPDVRGANALEPVILPEQESSWFTFARAGDDAFVVATIDTTGSARVSRITIGESGVQRVALFELPATDPQFEVHVIDGGTRILALGKDHRVRLFDSAGNVLSQIDEYGFTPWQLRVVERPGQPVALAVVLTQPVRAQALALDGDTLKIVGEPWMVALDQSPNRNDMVLSPDGKTIAALRRNGKRGRGFALQLIELATGTRRVIVGELDEKARPRLHYTANDRVLLESGSGKGFWIDLAQAVPRDAAEFPPAVMQAVTLPAAAGDLRMQVTEVAGVRAIATGDVLTIDPLDTTDHQSLRRIPISNGPLALDETGTTLAWGNKTTVSIENLETRTDKIDVEAGADALALAFDEDAHLVIATSSGTTVRDAKGDAVATTGTLPTLPLFDAVAAERGARSATLDFPIRGRNVRAAVPAPAGNLLAVAISKDILLLSNQSWTPAVLDVFDGETKQRLWSSPLDNIGHVAWSGDGRRIAMHDAEAIVVLDARTGDRVFARSDAGLKLEIAKD